MPSVMIFTVSSLPVKRGKVLDAESDEEDQLKRKARPSRKSITGIVRRNPFIL